MPKNFKKIDCRKITNKFLASFDFVIFLAGLSNNPIDDIFPNKAYKVVEYELILQIFLERFKNKILTT